MTKDSPFPDKFQSRLSQIIPQNLINCCESSFRLDKSYCIRVNTLTAQEEVIIEKLKNSKFDFEFVVDVPNALVINKLKDISIPGLVEKLANEGKIYKQSLSSMLVPLVMDPQAGERVLDMCAAPGSKSTQMAAMMRNQGEIVCLEPVRKRFYRLKSVASLLKADILCCHLTDGRKYRTALGDFDRILVDAPCSSEGRFHISNKKSYAYWSLRKIKEMARKQKGLLLNASRLLKSGGEMVYSTCTFAPEENESVVDWLLRKTEGRLKVMDCSMPVGKTYPCLKKWNDRDFNPQIEKCIRVLPDSLMDAFFIAKLKKM